MTVPQENAHMHIHRDDAAADADAAGAHPRSRQLGLIAFAVILLMATVAVPLIAGASTYRGGFTVNTSGAAVHGNLYVASFRSRIDTDVQGDLALAAFTSSVYGDVDGSVHVLSGRTSIRGDVQGSVYVVSGNVDVHGTVGGDLVIASGRATLVGGSAVDGDVIVLAGQVGSNGAVEGSIYGTALLMGQDGTVGGNLDVQADRLSISGGATIEGGVRYQSPIDADISSGATIRGDTERTNAAHWSGIGDGALAPFGPLLTLTWTLVLAAALVAVAPRLMYRYAEMATPVVQPAIIGAIALLSIPVFAVLAMLTILALPVGVLMLVGYVVGVYLSQVIVGMALGRFLLPRRWRDGSRGYLLLAGTIGLILIGILRLMPFPFVNMAVVLVVTVLGFGAFISILLDLTSERLRASRRRYA
jgi:cytoskeletal protein CcmA (bactofilin family)